MDNRQVVATLNKLLETTKDGESGFRTCAESVTKPGLKTVFEAAARRCDEGAAESAWLSRRPMSFAGTPPAIEKGGKERFTTAPAANTDPLPIVTPSRMRTPLPTHTSSSSVMPRYVPPCSLIGTSTSSNCLFTGTIVEWAAIRQ